MSFVRPGSPPATTALRPQGEPPWEACAQTLNLHSVIATDASFASWFAAKVASTEVSLGYQGVGEKCNLIDDTGAHGLRSAFGLCS